MSIEETQSITRKIRAFCKTECPNGPRCIKTDVVESIFPGGLVGGCEKADKFVEKLENEINNICQ